ncbi:MAG: 6-phosphofructokinase [Thermoproteota archaeon]
MEVVGIERGDTRFTEERINFLDIRSVSGVINRGGTILKTARCEEIKKDKGMQKAVHTFETHKIERLIFIGRDGSFRGQVNSMKLAGPSYGSTCHNRQ